jgi:hypothetical protein
MLEEQMPKYIAALSLSLCLVTTAASAQSAGDIISQVESFVHSTMAKAARSRWSKLPELEYACIEQKLQERGDSLQTLMKRGVFPNDSRVAKIRSQCHGASASQAFQRLKDQAYKRSERDTLFPASDYRDCDKACRETSSCMALTYFRMEQICRLMPAVTELREDEGADSAFRIEPITGSVAPQTRVPD